MSTQYLVVEAGSSKIELDERSCQYDLDVYIGGGEMPFMMTFLHRATAEQIVEIAAKLIGPLFYQYPDGKFVELLEEKLKAGGYT